MIKKHFNILILNYLFCSAEAGKVWLLATNQPFFFRAAPILFNKKIISILPSEGRKIIRVNLIYQDIYP